MRAGVLACLTSVLATSCIFDGDLKHRNDTVPEQLDDGWQVATPASVGIDPGVLAALHEELLREDRHVGTLGLLVIKDDKLVWETYLRTPEDRDHYHHLQSATKSVTSLLFGIVQERMEVPLTLTTGELFAHEATGLDPSRAAITVGDLLTMRSGIAFDNAQFSLEMWVDRPSDPVRYMLAKPMYAEPGERFYYRDVDPQLISHAISRIEGRSEEDIAAADIFAPLGITDWYWGSGTDGVSMGAHGLHLRPRDFAKLGQLVLDRGRWRDAQIIPESWIEISTSPQVESDRVGRDGDPFWYGYYWWIVAGVGYAAWGHGGQYALVVPSLRLVIAQISLPDADLHGSTLVEFIELVAPLVRGPELSVE